MAYIHIMQDTVNKNRKRENLINKILWIIIIVLLIMILLELLFHFFIAPSIKINSIVVESDLNLNEQEIIKLAGIDKTAYYFFLDTEEVKARLEEVPVIKKADVKKYFPNMLKLTVKAREPLAVTLIEDGNRSVPAILDNEGIIFQIGKRDLQIDLPVISGFQFRDYRIGMRLPEKLYPLFSQLDTIRDKSMDLYRFISEIKVIPIGSGDYEQLFYMIPYKTRIRFGNKVSDKMLTYAIIVLDMFVQQGIEDKIEEIDFRTKEIVFQDKGGTIN